MPRGFAHIFSDLDTASAWDNALSEVEEREPDESVVIEGDPEIYETLRSHGGPPPDYETSEIASVYGQRAAPPPPVAGCARNRFARTERPANHREAPQRLATPPPRPRRDTQFYSSDWPGRDALPTRGGIEEQTARVEARNRWLQAELDLLTEDDLRFNNTQHRARAPSVRRESGLYQRVSETAARDRRQRERQRSNRGSSTNGSGSTLVRYGDGSIRIRDSRGRESGSSGFTTYFLT